MSSNEEKAVMAEAEVSPVVSTSSDLTLSSPEEDKCILTPLSLEFDPLSWKLDEKNQTNNNSNSCSPEHSSTTAAIVEDPVQLNLLNDQMSLMNDSVQSLDLLTMDDNCDTNTNHIINDIINDDKCETNAELIREFEPTLNCEYESNDWPNDMNVHQIENHLNGVNQNDCESDVPINSSLVSIEANDRSTNECQIASLLSDSNTFSEQSLMSEPFEQTNQSHSSGHMNMNMNEQNVNASPLISINTCIDTIDTIDTIDSIDTIDADVSSANQIAAKLVDDCVSDALHENALLLPKHQMLNSSSSLSASSLSDHMSSESDESVQSVSSASSGTGSGSGRRKKKNTRKKALNATKSAQLSSPAKAQSSAPHELPEQLIATEVKAKSNSIETNKKSIEKSGDNHVVDKKPELNGHTANGDEINDMNADMSCLPAINGFHKHINHVINDNIEPSLNGHKKHYDFDNDSLNESTFATEPEYCVNVAKLCSTYTKSDAIDRTAVSKGVIITGISLKTLKNLYVNHVEYESQLLKSYPKEIANTGIDLKSLKSSYVSTVEHNVVNKNAVNKELLPIGVNINSIKSTFNSEQEMSESDKVDKTRGPKKFAQVNKDAESMCKVCSKHVYQMEKIKAEKSVFHKQCFRCKECNKQLNVDNYSSHEAELYCMPHFKQLFQPKAKFDTEDNQQRRQKKYEMIIRENTPQELPPEVVRSNSKVDDEFDNLSLDLANIRNRFESGPEDSHNTQSQNSDKSSLQRSESIHIRMQKYQSAVSGEKESNQSSEDEQTDPKDNANEREKVVFSGLSSLKSQWEKGSISGEHRDDTETTKEELENLRKKLSLGRSESLKQVYERAVKESNAGEGVANRSDAIVLDTSVKTNTIKEKFEKGGLESETEEQRVERLKREREEEINAINESETTAKEARNKFKQIDASATRGQTVQQNGNSNQTNGFTKKFSTNGDVIKSGGPIGDDVSIDSAQLQQRFSYFENLPKEGPKEPKRHQITPPRDVTHVYENNVEENHSSNIVRSSDVIEDIPKVDTAKKMLDKFKALENQMDSQSNAPKPIKRITPPRDYTADNGIKKEVTPERDPNIIKSSLKDDSDIQVEPEKARNLKAKFENWSAEIDRENKRNNGYDDEDEFIPHIDTTKNLRAKFEAIKDEGKPVDKPKVRVNRFVCETGDNSASDLCYVCRTKLYPMEKLEFSGLRLHKNCFRCIKCKCNLRLDNFTITAEKLYCIPHFKQLFMERGNYEQGFGLEKSTDKWNSKCINNNDLIINNNNNKTHNNQLICDVNANDAHIDYETIVSDASDNDY